MLRNRAKKKIYVILTEKLIIPWVWRPSASSPSSLLLATVEACPYASLVFLPVYLLISLQCLLLGESKRKITGKGMEEMQFSGLRKKALESINGKQM